MAPSPQYTGPGLGSSSAVSPQHPSRGSSTIDPRTYVRPVPLPIPSVHGLKMQARSEAFLNPTVPDRQSVRSANYVRRKQQSLEQGFASRNDKPYKGIGDPFFLDYKELILHALGQWDEKQADWMHSSEEEDDDGDNNMQKSQQVASASYVRRTRKDLNTLPKEVANAKAMIKGCKLGWGLFDMLQREKNKKAEAKLREIRRQKERLRTEWQPPKYDSSSECETDDDLSEDIDINQYMAGPAVTTATQLVPPPVNQSALSPAPSAVGSTHTVTQIQPPTPQVQADDENGEEKEEQIEVMENQEATEEGDEDEEDAAKAKVVFTGLEPPTIVTTSSTAPSPSLQQPLISARSSKITTSSSLRHRSRKLAPARPFTPQHSSITTPVTRGPEVADKEAVFRQLCALHWLLEAMNTEPPQQMSPLTTSWNLKEIGGYRTKDRKQERDKLDSRWKQFTANQHLKFLESTDDLTTIEEEGKKLNRKQSLLLRRQSSLKHPSLLQGATKPTEGSVDKPGPTRRNAGNTSNRMKSSSRRYSGHPSARLGSTSSLTSLSASTNHLTQSQTSIQLGSGTPGIRVTSHAIPENSEVMSYATPTPAINAVEDANQGEAMFQGLEDYTSLKEIEPHPPNYHPPGHPDDRSSSSNIDLSSSKSDRAASEQSPGSIRRSREKFGGVGGAGGAGGGGGGASSGASVRGSGYGSAGRHRRVGSAPGVVQEYRKLTQQDRANILEKLNKTDEDPRLQRLSNPTERRSSRTLRAEYNVRPISTDAVRDYECRMGSRHLVGMSSNMRHQFAEVAEEKALELHDALETIERDRLRKIHNKFSCLPMKGSFFRALKVMRSQVPAEETSPIERDIVEEEAIHQQWYTDVLHGLPEIIREEWHFKKILSKLAKYGMVESSKQSGLKLRRVLAGLRDWEICGPDVSAAIEFCREKIVEMAVDEYEDWFQSQFPAVVRPQTAPPACKTQAPQATTEPRSAPTVPRSAPPARTRAYTRS